MVWQHRIKSNKIPLVSNYFSSVLTISCSKIPLSVIIFSSVLTISSSKIPLVSNYFSSVLTISSSKILLSVIIFRQSWQYQVLHHAQFTSLVIKCHWNTLWSDSSFCGPLWSWSYGSWIYNYLCNQCLSPFTLLVRIPLMVKCTQYNIMW